MGILRAFAALHCHDRYLLVGIRVQRSRILVYCTCRTTILQQLSNSGILYFWDHKSIISFEFCPSLWIGTCRFLWSVTEFNNPHVPFTKAFQWEQRRGSRMPKPGMLNQGMESFCPVIGHLISLTVTCKNHIDIEMIE